MDLRVNIVFDNRYTLICQLGRGGFSEVWLAHDQYMDLDVAIKIYAPGQGLDQSCVDEFRHEIKGVFNLNHPNLLKPQHLGIFNNMPYLVLSYCKSGSVLKQVGKMSEQQIWKLIYDVASGLAYLHQRDIVHQDIKPDNILIDNNGNYVITDFGISAKARRTLSKSTAGNNIDSGTLAYMGPERYSKQPAPTKASDIWSFGAMVYELVTGNVPFGEMGGNLQKNGAEIPEITHPISNELRTTIERMLSLETWDRPTADTLVKLALTHLKGEDIQIAEHPKARKKRWSWLLSAVIALLSLFAVVEICIYEPEVDKSRVENTIKEICRNSSKGGDYISLQKFFTETVSPYHKDKQFRLNSEIPEEIRSYVEQYPEYEISEPFNFKYDNSSFPLTVKCDIFVTWTLQTGVRKRAWVHKTYYITSRYKVSGYLDDEYKRVKL